MAEESRKIVGSEGLIGQETTQKPDLVQRVIDDTSFVRINSFQEYVFEAKRERGGLKLNNGYRFSSAEDRPHEEIRQIRSIISRHGGPKEKNWDEDKFGCLYVASYPSEDSWIIWGGGRTGKDFVGRPNNISFQIQLQDAELASEFMKAIIKDPTPTLQMFMSKVFVNEQGQQLLPTDKVRTQHRQYMDPFLVPIAEVKAVEIKKPESRPAVVENHQPQVYNLSSRNLTMSETQRNAPPPGQESTPAVENKGPIFDSSAGTDVGKVREHNEDVVRIDEQNLRHMGIDGLYIVADGMGGHGAGEVASAIAADVMAQQCLKQEFPRQIQAFDQLPPDKKREQELVLQEKQRKWLAKAVGQANHAVFERSRNSTNTAEKDMGTTLVVAIRSGDQVAVANVGDSRAYIISGDGKTIQQTTRDHSLVASLVAVGQITPAEARVHKQRNQIYRTIGDKPRVEADVFFAKIPQGGSMILCSDGLSGMVEDGQIGRIVVSAPDSRQAVSGLINAANAAGGQDNISAIVVRNVAEAVQTKEAEALSVEETSAISAIEVMVGLEKTSGSLDREKLKESFLMARLTFGKLPQTSRVRTEIMKKVSGQLGAEGEKMRKARKSDEQIFEEWLKQVFVPLYRRTKKP